MKPKFSFHLSILLLVSIVLVSGCTNLDLGGTRAGHFDSGLVIQDFEAEMDSVYSKESVNFRARIKNLGSFEVPSGSIRIELSEWGKDCRNSKSHEFNLLPPDEERGTEGEEAVFSWECDAPDIEEGLKIPYEARAELEYDYRTIASKSLTLLPTRELIALKNAGKSLPTTKETHSHSPLRVDIQIKGPIRIRETGNVDFPVTFHVKNVGGGIVRGDETDHVTMKIDPHGGLRLGSSCSDYSTPQALDLWRGQSQTITCRMSAERVSAMTEGRIAVILNYKYLLSSSARIEVVGTSRSAIF